MHDANFSLHPQLLADTTHVTDLPLCKLLLLNDKNYPWTILVPARPGITELHQLTQTDQHQLLEESSQLATALEQLYQPDKLNIAALGNVVPQLHLHHIARFKTDTAWPAPVWGATAAQPYTAEEMSLARQNLLQAINPQSNNDH